MKRIHALALLLMISAKISIAHGQTPKVKDYLAVPGSLNFDNKNYQLAWSSHPTPTYYKQEYITPGDKLEKFKSMLLVELLVGTVKPADAAKAKMDELAKLKSSNPLVNYEVFENKESGEFMLDFLLNQPGGNTETATFERNIYRYVPVQQNGKQALALFAISVRSYNMNARQFLTDLKKSKTEMINKFAAYTLPQLKIPNE